MRCPGGTGGKDGSMAVSVPVGVWAWNMVGGPGVISVVNAGVEHKLSAHGSPGKLAGR